MEEGRRSIVSLHIQQCQSTILTCWFSGLVAGGCYAERVAVNERMIWKKPSCLSWAQAAAIPEQWLTAYQTAIASQSHLCDPSGGADQALSRTAEEG